MVVSELYWKIKRKDILQVPNQTSSGYKKHQRAQQGESNYVLAEIPESGNRYGTSTTKVRCLFEINIKNWIKIYCQVPKQNTSEYVKHQGFQQDNIFYALDETFESGNKYGTQTTTVISIFKKYIEKYVIQV